MITKIMNLHLAPPCSTLLHRKAERWKHRSRDPPFCFTAPLHTYGPLPPPLKGGRGGSGAVEQKGGEAMLARKSGDRLGIEIIWGGR